MTKNLFDKPRNVPMNPERHQARGTDPATSHQANADNMPRRGTQRWRILEYLHANGPSLADQWEAEFVWRSGPRASELKRMGLIRPTGKTAETRFGSQAEVLELTEQGAKLIRAALEEQD